MTFMNKYLQGSIGTITLEGPTRHTWRVQWTAWDQPRRRFAFTGGWTEFAKAQNAKIGDVLVLEVIDNSRFKFQLISAKGVFDPLSLQITSTTGRPQDMENNVEELSLSEASDDDKSPAKQETTPNPVTARVEATDIESKAKFEGEVPPLTASSIAPRARTAVWRQRVHSGAGAPVLAGQKILEIPSHTNLATQIGSTNAPAANLAQRMPTETLRSEIKAPLLGPLPVAYRSLPSTSSLISLTPSLLSPSTALRLPAPGLSPLPANLSLFSPGLSVSSTSQRRIPIPPSGLTPPAGGLVPLPTNIPRGPPRPGQANRITTKARMGHLCHSVKRSCSQYCLEGFKYCLWHILEDPSAPYKQCEFVELPTQDHCLFPVSRKSANTRYVKLTLDLGP